MRCDGIIPHAEDILGLPRRGGGIAASSKTTDILTIIKGRKLVTFRHIVHSDKYITVPTYLPRQNRSRRGFMSTSCILGQPSKAMDFKWLSTTL